MAEKFSFSEQKVINIINDINMYLKFLEQRIVKTELEIRSLSEKIEKLEKKIEENKNLSKKEIESINASIANLSLELEKIRMDIKKKADLSELREIKELLDLFNPLKSIFVTKEEVKRIFNELINNNRK